MRKPLPSRTAVLDLLTSQDRALDAREVAERLGVAPASQAGLLRMLDDLVFDGVVTARGDKFKLGSAEKAPEKTRAARRPSPSQQRATAPARSAHGGPARSRAAARSALQGAPEGRAARRRRNAHRRPPRQRRALEPRRARARAGGAPRSSGRAQDERGCRSSHGRAAPKLAVEPRGPPRAAEAPRATARRARPAKSGGRSDRERREGFLKVNPRGFGFVASPTASGDDVYISPENLGGAMHGDHVIIDIVARGSRGPEGHIVEIKARGSQRVSGILRRRGKSAWVELDDPRMKGPVVLTSEIDKTSAEGEGNSGKDGQVVVVQITRFPETTTRTPRASSSRCSARPASSSVETRKVILIHGIEEVHSAEAIAEAEAYGADRARGDARRPRGPHAHPAAHDRSRGRARSRRRGLGRAHEATAATSCGSRSPT